MGPKSSRRLSAASRTRPKSAPNGAPCSPSTSWPPPPTRNRWTSADESTHNAIRSAAHYFENHRNHLDYPSAAKLGLPMGSGSMESQCAQFQNRFKRRGPFWMKRGFPGLLELSVRHQNGELAPLWAA